MRAFHFGARGNRGDVGGIALILAVAGLATFIWRGNDIGFVAGAGDFLAIWSDLAAPLLVVSGLVVATGFKASRRAFMVPLMVWLGIQVPVLDIGGLHFQFYAGARLGLVVVGPEIQALVRLGTGAALYIREASQTTIVGINVVALLCLISLAREWVASDEDQRAEKS